MGLRKYAANTFQSTKRKGGKDAAKVGKILNIPTEKHEDGLYSVCRFPRISLNENYLPQLVRAGGLIAIIDEL